MNKEKRNELTHQQRNEIIKLNEELSSLTTGKEL